MLEIIFERFFIIQTNPNFQCEWCQERRLTQMDKRVSFHRMVALVGLLTAVLVLFRANPAGAVPTYQVTNLVSDIPGLAANTDPNLVNPWGITSSSTSPFWISDNGTGVATLYNGSGQPFPVLSPLVVTVPPPAGGAPPSTPTGQVFNGGSSFDLGRTYQPASSLRLRMERSRVGILGKPDQCHPQGG